MQLSLPRSAFDAILKHLVKVEDEREFVLDACFPQPCEERERLRALLDQYIKSMNELVGKTKVYSDKDEESPAPVALPFVMVGSEVSVVDLGCGESLNYRVQHPFKTDGDGGEVSYISPLGAALLMKKPGQELAVHTPGGEFRYRIESIRPLLQ